jgi:hypothetical protein
VDQINAAAAHAAADLAGAFEEDLFLNAPPTGPLEPLKWSGADSVRL